MKKKSIFEVAKQGDYVRYPIKNRYCTLEYPETGHEGTQTFEVTEINFRYCGVEGQYAILVSEEALNSDLILCGLNGAIYGPAAIDKVCKLYENEDFKSLARSISSKTLNSIPKEMARTQKSYFMSETFTALGDEYIKTSFGGLILLKGDLLTEFEQTSSIRPEIWLPKDTLVGEGDGTSPERAWKLYPAE